MNYKAINSRVLKFSSQILGAELKEEQAKYERVEGVQSVDIRLRYCTLKVFHLL